MTARAKAAAVAGRNAHPLIVAGVMSGTSADGVDVALCRIAPGLRPGDSPRVRLLGHLGFPYPKTVRAAVLQVMEGEPLPAAEMSRLNWRLGEIYAECIEKTAAKLGVRADLVGCHGQTVHHETTPTRYLGKPVRSTWQTGEAAAIAERLRCPVVGDFRPADLAAGGQGAPLVPMLDWCLFRSPKVNRVLLNLGGIANLTVLPAGCTIDRVLAFDTGPANMVIDACMTTLLKKKIDRNGAVARRGRVLRPVLDQLLCDPYFSALPPKSCGREQFGAAFALRLMQTCLEAGCEDADCIATATALTAESVLAAYARFVQPLLTSAAERTRTELCVAGGGAKNARLMAMLRDGFTPLSVKVRITDDLGIPSQAKEAVAFALLAWLTWNGLTGNVPAATGAHRPTILGKVSYG
jgi:anhydro-N-acetylmuramic acid kinase